MRYLIIFIVVLMGCYDDPEQYSRFDFVDTGIVAERQSETGPVVLVMGDSRGHLGDEWHYLRATVYNVAFGGTTMYGVKHRIHYVNEIQPDYVIIFGGVNESRFSTTFDEWRTVFDANVQAIIDAGAIPVLCDPFTARLDGGEYISREIRAYLRNTYNDYYFDSATEISWFRDHVHFSSFGYEKISENINMLF